jgi:hypothetical protein
MSNISVSAPASWAPSIAIFNAARLLDAGDIDPPIPTTRIRSFISVAMSHLLQILVHELDRHRALPDGRTRRASPSLT